MKLNRIFLAISLFAILLFTSCEKDDSNEFDFTGVYTGIIDCNGPLSADNGSAVSIIITTQNDIFYIDIGDNTVFEATQDQNKLIVQAQTLNAGGDIDVIFLEGEIEAITDNQIEFSFNHNVDKEGQSSCSFTLTK